MTTLGPRHQAWIAQWQDQRGIWDSREFETEEEARAHLRTIKSPIRTDVRLAWIRDVAPRGEVF